MGVMRKEEAMNNTTTVEEIKTGLEPLISVLTAAQRQGDLLVVPAGVRASRPVRVGSEGITIVKGEHDHTLLAEGDVTWQQFHNRAHQVGCFIVEPGSVAYLFHDDHHRPLAFGPGSYVCRRQRELVDGRKASRFVED
jgi:hypothetical protein